MSRDKSSSEWPQFASRGPDGINSRTDRRIVTNPNLTLSAPSDEHPAGKLGSVSASATPLIQQLSQGSTHSHVPTPVSRRGSPPNLLEGMGIVARSVPGTPLGGLAGTPSHFKTPGTPHTPDARLSPNETSSGNNDLQASLSRASHLGYDASPRGFSSGPPSSLDEVRPLIRLPLHESYNEI